jgi:GDPmannose 4,6-dehydratase
MKLAFISGITGQDGSYLTELLWKRNYKVYGFVRRTSLLYTNKRIEHLRYNITLRYGDLTDFCGLNTYLNDIIKKNKDFDVLEIYNLGAQSHVKVSFELPKYTTEVDSIGVLHLLEIIRSFSPNIQSKIKFYQAGTSEMYGKVLNDIQNEETPFNPVSPYGCAKVYSHFLVKCYRKSYNLFLTNGILFNHESPRRGVNFLTMKVINGVKEISEGKRTLIRLGNLNSKRDWGHAKDYVMGMWLMLQQQTPDDYVLSTGETHTVRSFVEKAFAYKGYQIQWKNETGNEVDEYGIDQHGQIRVIIDEQYFRPYEVDLLLGDSSKATKQLGWKRQFDTLDKIIEDMFENILV